MGRNSRIRKLSMFPLCFKINCSCVIMPVKMFYLRFALLFYPYDLVKKF
jgi:hypothetical protein